MNEMMGGIMERPKHVVRGGTPHTRGRVRVRVKVRVRVREALLERGALVLPVLPAMAEEEMVAAVRGGRRQHHRLAWSGLGLGLGLGSGLGLGLGLGLR